MCYTIYYYSRNRWEYQATFRILLRITVILYENINRLLYQ
jgi:hypothetical protein